MNGWQRYVTRNPMLAESRRAFRKFFRLGKASPSALRIGLLITGVLYAVAVIVYSTQVGAFAVFFAVNIQVLLFLLLPVIGFYAAFSGEREKRTWDLLRVAPVTRGQIVAAKFMGGLLVLGTIWLATLPFVLIAGCQDQDFLGMSARSVSLGVKVGATLQASSVALATGIVVLALTLLLSARCKTSVAALCVGLGSIFCWNAILPMLYSMLMPSSPESVMQISMSPFMLANLALRRLTLDDNPDAPQLGGNIFFYWIFVALATTIFIIWTERTLVFVENDVRFLPQNKNAGS